MDGDQARPERRGFGGRPTAEDHRSDQSSLRFHNPEATRQAQQKRIRLPAKFSFPRRQRNHPGASQIPNPSISISVWVPCHDINRWEWYVARGICGDALLQGVGFYWQTASHDWNWVYKGGEERSWRWVRTPVAKEGEQRDDAEGLQKQPCNKRLDSKPRRRWGGLCLLKTQSERELLDGERKRCINWVSFNLNKNFF